MAIIFSGIQRFLGTTLILLVVCQGLNALTCHICGGKYDKPCEGTPEKGTGVDCAIWCRDVNKGFIASDDPLLVTPCPTKDFTVCRKIDYTIYPDPKSTDKDTVRTMRTCGFEGTDKQNGEEYVTSRLDRSTRTVYNCRSNECNTGSRFTVLTGLPIVCVIGMIFRNILA